MGGRAGVGYSPTGIITIMLYKLLVFACIVAVALSMKQKSCSIKRGSTRKAKIHKISVNPDPVYLSRRGFTVSVHAELFKPISGRVEIDLSLKKKVGFLWTPVPCVAIGGCVKNICTELKKAHVKDYQCPFQPQVIQQNEIKIHLPTLPAALQYVLEGKI